MKISKSDAQNIEAYMGTYNKYSEKFYSFIRWLVLMSLTFLTVFVSLSSDSQHIGWLLYLYIVLVMSISLGILFSAIILYGELARLNGLLSSLRQVLNKPLDDRADLEVSQGNLSKLYIYSEKIAFIFYIVFILSFVAYSIVKVL